MLPLLFALAVTAGPLARPCPEQGAVARTAEALRSLLAAQEREIWVGGRIKGDFSVQRGVALHGCDGAVLEGSGSGTVLAIRGDDVLVEDLTIEHSGARVSSEDGALKVSGKRAMLRRIAAQDTLYGIALEQCERCTLEATRIEGRAGVDANQRGDGIKLWEAHHAVVRKNVVRRARDVVVWYSRHVTIEDNLVTEGRYGTHFMYAHDATVRRNQLRHNTVGIFMMYSARLLAEDNVLAGAKGAAGMGIGFKEADAVTLRRNWLVANTVGAYFDNTPRDPSQPVAFEHNTLALNAVALRLHGSERGAMFAQNDFLANDRVLEVDGNGDAREAKFDNNYWEPYAGYDLDSDGEGDVAYQLKQPSSVLTGMQPLLRYFHGTAALDLYQALSMAVPYFGSRVVLEDPRPSMRPHREVPR